MDWQSVQPLFTWLSANPGLAGLFVFLIALSESLLIVGLIVPGTVLMFGVGTLVGAGALDIKQTLLIAFLGAVAGDGISFWIGRHYRQQLAGFWPFNKKPEYLQNGQRFFLKHGGKSILFGRFVGPVRPIIPAVAGMMGMPARNFLFVNVISALAWAPFYLIPGIIFGTSVGIASQVGTRLVIVLLSVVTGIIVLFWFSRKVMKYVIPRADAYFQKTYRWTSRHSILGPYILAIIDSKTSERRGLLVFSLLAITLSIFSAFLIAQIAHKDILGLDIFVENLMNLIRSDVATEFFLFFQEISRWEVISFTLANAAVLFYAFNRVQALRHLLLILFLGASSVLLIDFILTVTSTREHLIFVLKLVVLGCFASIYAIMLSTRLRETIRWLIYSVVLLLIVLVAVSGLYFGQLSFSSLMITVNLIIVWVLLIGVAYRRHSEFLSQSLFMSGTTITVFLLMALLITRIDFDRDLANINIIQPKTQISIDQWENEIWKPLVSYRSDVFGKQKQFFNVQWLADLKEIEASLLSQGWQLPPALNFRSFISWLKPGLQLEEYARLPQSNNGRHEQLVLVKYIADKQKQLVLQLWKSGYQIDTQTYLWLGSVTYQTLDTNLKWLPYLKIDDQYNMALASLEQDIKTWQVKSEFTTDESGLAKNRVFMIRNE